MAFNISYIIEAIDKFSPAGRAIQQSMSAITSKANRLSTSLEGVHKSLTKMGMAATARLTAPISALGIASVKASSSVERWQTSWEVYTHNAKKAHQITKQLMDWAKKTPFRIPDVEKSGLILAGLTVPVKQILPILKQAGNVAALTLKPLSLLAVNYGKVIASHRLYGIELKELRQIGVAVIPEFNKLNKAMGKPAANLHDLVTQGRISAQDFQQIFAFMAKDLYAQGTEKIAMTLSGMYTTVRDNMFLTEAALGEQITKVTNLRKRVMGLNAAMTRFTEALSPWIKAHQQFAGIAVEAGIILALLGPTLMVLGQIAWAVWGISKAFAVVLTLVRAITTVAMFLTLTGPGLIITAIGLIIVGLVLVLHHFYRWAKIAGVIKTAFHDIARVAKIIAIPFKPLIFLFKELWRLLKLIGKGVWHHFLSPIDEGQKNLGSIAALARTAPIGAMAAGAPMFGQKTLFGKQPVPVASEQSIYSSLAISLHDPAKFIKSLAGVSTGNMTLDTGTNMMLSRI
jgi:hypothetical protein